MTTISHQNRDLDHDAMAAGDTLNIRRSARKQADAEAQGYICARCPECGDTIRGQSWHDWVTEDCRCGRGRYIAHRPN